MPLSPIHVTPEDHDGLDGNPWDDYSNDNDHHRATNKSQIKRPANTRRTSSGWSSHTRSHTTAGHPLRSPSPAPAGELHGALGRGSSVDLHETRPSLRRVINASRANSDGEESDGIVGRNPVGCQEVEEKRDTDAEVIVHQIQPTDSLPGVALKYNISLATLRTANKLWASDSIHLRQVLYIPVGSITTTTAKSVPTSLRQHPRPGLSAPSLDSSPDFRTQSSSRMRRSASEWVTPTDSETTITHALTAQTISAGTTSAIRRVPLSELSFFPPPSTTALSPSTHTRSRPPPPTLSSPVHSNTPQFNDMAIPPRVSSPSSLPFFSGTSGGSSHGTPTFGLTSFLNGARDEIIGRLSLDSARGSSDTGEMPEVEMDVVRSRHMLDRRGDDEDGEDNLRDIKPRHKGSAFDIESGLARESMVLNTPRKPKVVRTVQLQPSPRMEIPALTKSRLGLEPTANRTDNG